MAVVVNGENLMAKVNDRMLTIRDYPVLAQNVSRAIQLPLEQCRQRSYENAS
jgi:hypothetical protein